MILISSSQRHPVVLLYLCLIALAIVFFIPLVWYSSPSSSKAQHVSLDDHPNLRQEHGVASIPAWQNSTRAKAAFVILTRNKEVDGVRQAMRQLEARFNHKFNYPYVFLNDEPFTEEFKHLTSSLTSAETKYGMRRVMVRERALCWYGHNNRIDPCWALECPKLDRWWKGRHGKEKDGGKWYSIWW